MTVTESTINHLYQSGMGISINNHETLSSDIQCKYKKQYQSLYKAIAGKKISRNSIKVDSGRPPTKNLINNIELIALNISNVINIGIKNITKVIKT